MTKHVVERSFLVRKVEIYEIDLPPDTDPHHLITHHFTSFYTDVGNDGTLTGTREDETDYEELRLEVIDTESAKIIPLSQGRKRT